jgi:hypothetical protein
VMNLHPISYPTMQLSIFFHRFRCVLDSFQNGGSCGTSNIFWLVVRFDKRTTLWLRRSTRLYSSRALVASRKATGEEDDRKIWIEYYVFFILDFFHM